MKVERLYELALSPQDGVKFVRPPGKKGLADGAFAGLVHFKVPATGSYRVSLSEAFWIDVVSHDELVSSTDFTGAQGCSAKIWVRQLTPVGGGLTTPENWLVPQTTPRPATVGAGSGVIAA